MQKMIKIAACLVVFVFSSLTARAEEGTAQTLDDADALQRKAGAGQEIQPSPPNPIAAQGQQATPVSVPTEDSPKLPDTPEVLARKVELAKTMHKIRPTAKQIDEAIRRASLSLPENQRNLFMNTIAASLNYNAIERISVDSMVEVFTLPELEAMVEYYSKPEAASASDKMNDWASKVQPEIIRLIDRAIMKARLGQ